MKCYSPISDIEIFSFPFQPIDSRMYLVFDSSEREKAVVIDPCICEHASLLLTQHGVKKITVILTHEHYDHISGVNWIKNLFNCTVITNEVCASIICDPAKNRSKYFPALFVMHPKEIQEQIRKMNIQPYSCEADKTFSDNMTMTFGKHQIFLKETPGHSPSSICAFIDDKCMFSGDTLLRTQPILRKPEGDKKIYYEKTLPWLKTLSKRMLVYPGHGDAGIISEMYF